MSENLSKNSGKNGENSAKNAKNKAKNENEFTKGEARAFSVIFFLFFVAIIAGTGFGVAFGYKHYSVWAAEMDGKAALLKATQTRQILVEQAKAEFEAAKECAKAIEVIGEMATKYPQYRQQEFIAAFAEAVNNGNINTIIYVPTEANIPILEAGKLGK